VTDHSSDPEHHVAAAVLLGGGRVLLCHRAPGRRWSPDVWDFPGGHLEPGESEEEALRRELREELGVEVRESDMVALLHKKEPAAHLELGLFAVRSWSGSVENRQPSEHDEIGWFARHELAGLQYADPGYLDLLGGLLA
jgi:8-oxo-dGTP diphosphatase